MLKKRGLNGRQAALMRSRAPWLWLLALGSAFVLPRWSVSEDLWAHAVGAPNGAVELSQDDYRRRLGRPQKASKRIKEILFKILNRIYP